MPSKGDREMERSTGDEYASCSAVLDGECRYPTPTLGYGNCVGTLRVGST
jgi:hypothetical protein